MSDYRLTPQAADDLFDIWTYIAADNLDAANLVETAILKACGFVAESPLRGHARTDLTPLPLRFWAVQPYRNYLIVFDPDSSPLRVVRILHGSRNAARILGPSVDFEK